jgi:hypothetical protein
MKEKELAQEQAQDLPDREAMSVIAVGDNVAAPVNEATALNYQSDYSIAVADADQIVIVDQTDVDPDTDPVDDAEQETVRGRGRGGRRG